MASAGTLLAPFTGMILKGPDAYFKVPAVRTVSSSTGTGSYFPGGRAQAGLPLTRDSSCLNLRAALEDLFGTLEAEGRDRRPETPRPLPRVSPVAPSAPVEPVRPPIPARPPFPEKDGSHGLDRRAFEIQAAIEAAFPSDGTAVREPVDPMEIEALLDGIFPAIQPLPRTARPVGSARLTEPVFEIAYDFELRCLQKVRLRSEDWTPVGLIQPLDRVGARF